MKEIEIIHTHTFLGEMKLQLNQGNNKQNNI